MNKCLRGLHYNSSYRCTITALTSSIGPIKEEPTEVNFSLEFWRGEEGIACFGFAFYSQHSHSKTIHSLVNLPNSPRINSWNAGVQNMCTHTTFFLMEAADNYFCSNRISRVGVCFLGILPLESQYEEICHWAVRLSPLPCLWVQNFFLWISTNHS